MLRLVFISLAFISLAGCGYTTGSLLSSNYQTISIESFKNKVGYLDENKRGLYIPLLENKAHDAIVTRFQQDGHLKVNTSQESDLILQGDLIGFEREDVRRDDNNSVQEYRVRVTVSLRLIDPSGEKEEWIEPSFSGEATYYIAGPLAKSESQALDEALTDLSRRVVERTLENW